MFAFTNPCAIDFGEKYEIQMHCLSQRLDVIFKLKYLCLAELSIFVLVEFSYFVCHCKMHFVCLVKLY